MIATARLMMPKAFVRLSAGRTALNREAQLLCFAAGANSIFYGEKLLTTPNPEEDEDVRLLRDAGLKPLVLDLQPRTDHDSPNTVHASIEAVQTHSH